MSTALTQNSTLAEFDSAWRAPGASGRVFYAMICEAVLNSRADYERLTRAMILERKAQTTEARIEVIRGVLRSLDNIASDRELIKSRKRMDRAHDGMVVWLNLLKSMLAEESPAAG